MDQPKRALELYARGLEHFPTEIQLLLAVGRTHEALQDPGSAMLVYKQVLAADPSCVEAIANLACHSFYTDQPEVSLRYYRRLVQVSARVN
jgi:tetratricopeptide repeat protein 8